MNRKRFPLKRISISLCLILLLLFTGGCQKNTAEFISDTGIYFDTVISIKIYDSTDVTLLSNCFSMCEDFENRFSRTIKGSEISKINNAGGQPVTVSPDTVELIQKGLYYSELSNGAFDITIAPLSDLWNFKSDDHIIPSEASLNEALSHVDYHKVHVDGTTVTLEDPKAAIDLGGIAKGYIADKLKSYLEEQGVKHALISLGGNIIAIGGKDDTTPFTIGIQKPFGKQGEALLTLSTQNQSIVTSGIYERYFEKNDTIYHHILNPENGFPYTNNLYSVTIISDASVDGDGLSTTCLALGLEDGMKFIEGLEGTDAIFITDTYEIYDTRK